MSPRTAGFVAGAALLALVAHTVVVVALRRWGCRAPGHVLRKSLIANMTGPTRIIVPLVAAEVALGSVRVNPRLESPLLHWVGVALVLSVAFAIVRATYVLDDLILGRYRLETENNLKARRVHTQIQVFRRLTVVVVAVVSLAVVLLSFQAVRAAGAGLLASAGLVGILAGVAAKPTATNVVAGLQLAISQPIRVDDVVVVEGQFGRVEEIALTYVVVRVWDLRRLVVPVSYFIQNSFENWTRSTSEVLGWVFLDVDYRAPVEAIRQRFQQILDHSPNWDGHTSVLQVTDAGETGMQLRALMSSFDSSRSWDLQCEVREKLLGWIQAEHPEALPRRRAVLVAEDAGNRTSDRAQVFSAKVEPVGHRRHWDRVNRQPREALDDMDDQWSQTSGSERRPGTG